MAQTQVIADDLELFEMANLGPAQTGIEGTIYISTQQAGHAPRVKYYAGRPGPGQPSMSVVISDQPEVAISDVPERVMRQMAPAVIGWVKLNHEKLNNFWFHGGTWMDDEVTAFKASLAKWPAPITPQTDPAP